MADVKFSQFPSGTPATGAQVVGLDALGANVRMQTDDLKTPPAGVDGAMQFNNSGVLATIPGTVLDSTGNARGVGALDLQTSRALVTQVAVGPKSTAIGNENTIEVGGLESTAVGHNNTIPTTGIQALAVGLGNTANGYNSAGVGYKNTCGEYGQAFGYFNVATGKSSTAVGYICRAYAGYSVAVGNYAEVSASADYAAAFGTNITNSVASSVDVGTDNTNKISILSSGTLVVRGAIQPATLTDLAAQNNALYYSSDAAALVYKDGAGVVNALYP